MKNKSFSDILLQLDQPVEAEQESELKNMKIKNPNRKQYGHRKPNEFLSSAEWLSKAYESSNVKQLSISLNVTRRAVLYWLDKHGIPRRNPIDRIKEANKLKKDKKIIAPLR